MSWDISWSWKEMVKDREWFFQRFFLVGPLVLSSQIIPFVIDWFVPHPVPLSKSSHVSFLSLSIRPAPYIFFFLHFFIIDVKNNKVKISSNGQIKVFLYEWYHSKICSKLFHFKILCSVQEKALSAVVKLKTETDRDLSLSSVCLCCLIYISIKNSNDF